MVKQTSLAPRAYLLAESALLLTLAYLLIFAGSPIGIVNYDVRRISLGVLTAIAVLWLAVAVRRIAQGQPLELPLAKPALLFLAAYLLTALTSIDPRRSLANVWLMAGYVCLLALTANLVRWGWPRELFTKVLLIVGGVLLGMGWYSVFQWYQAWLAAAPGHWLPDRLYRLDSSNILAMFWNVLLMVAIARWGPTRSRLSRGLLALWIAAALGLIYFSSSRGGWVGTGAGLAVLAAWGLTRPNALARWRELAQMVRRRPLLWGLGLAAVLLAGGAIAWLAYLQWTNPLHTPGLASRDYFWLPAWQAFLASPWVGQGPFTFGSIYLRTISVPPDVVFTHAHNVVINFLAETGLIGTLALAGLVAAACRVLWRRVNQLQGHNQAAVLGAGAALVAWAGHGLFDTVYIVPSNAALFAVLLGVALAAPATENRPVPASPWRGWTLIGLVAILVGAGWYGLWLAAPLHQGVMAANEVRWTDAEGYFEEAARRDSRSAIVYQQLGLANSALAEAGDAQALGRAATAFEQAARLDPDWPLNHANLGAVYAARGDYAAALAQLREAARRAPRAPLFFLNLGLVAEKAGYPDEARQAYAAALQLNSEAAYFWRSSPLRAAAWDAWQRVQPSPAAGGQESVAEQVRIYVQQGQLPAADALLRKTAIDDSSSSDYRWASAQLAAARQDYAQSIAQAEPAVQSYLAQSVYGPGTFGSSVYGSYLFRREAMAMDLAPQLTPLPLPDVWAARMVQLGDWYATSGNAVKAAEIYRDVLRLVPDNAEAQKRLK